MSGLRITIIRHGKPDEVGTTDPPLTETGRLQAEAACTALGRKDFDLAVSSPALRAQQTGASFVEVTGHSMQLEPAIDEIDYGDEEYVRVEEARARGDETWDLWKARLRATVDQPAEAAFISGVSETFTRLAAEHGAADVAVFSHGGVINALAALATRSPRLWLMLPDYCGISRFELLRGQFVIKTLNETAHLDGGGELSAKNLAVQ